MTRRKRRDRTRFSGHTRHRVRDRQIIVDEGCGSRGREGAAVHGGGRMLEMMLYRAG
jgi:hypothetical protein